MKSVDFYQESTNEILNRAETSRSKWFVLKEKLAASAKKINQLESKLARTVQQRDALYSKLDKLLKLEELDDDPADQIADTSTNQIKDSDPETNLSGEFILKLNNADISICTVPFNNSSISQATPPTMDGTTGNTDAASCSSTIPTSCEQKIIDNDTENLQISLNEDQKQLSDSQPKSSTVPSDSQLDASQKYVDQGHSVKNEETPPVENEIKSFECPKNSAEGPKDDSDSVPVSQPKMEVDSNDNVDSKIQSDQENSSSSPLRHSKKRLWECSICDRRFARAEILAKHIMKIHGTARSTLRCARGCISQTIKSLLKIKMKKRRNMNRKPNFSFISVVDQKQLRDQEKNTEKAVESSKTDESDESANSADTTAKDESSGHCGSNSKTSKPRNNAKIADLHSKNKSKRRNVSAKSQKTKRKTPEANEVPKKNSKMTLRRKSSRYNFRQKLQMDFV